MTGDFHAQDIFTASRPAATEARTRTVAGPVIPWRPIVHTGLATAAGAGTAAGLRLSGLEFDVVLTAGLAVLAFAVTLTVWTRSGPVWAGASALITVAFALLVAQLPLAIAAASLLVLAARTANRALEVSGR
jgi:hypothetical protein